MTVSAHSKDDLYNEYCSRCVFKGVLHHCKYRPHKWRKQYYQFVDRPAVVKYECFWFIDSEVYNCEDLF